MRKPGLGLGTTLTLLAGIALAALPSSAAAARDGQLNMYEARVDAAQLEELNAGGYDVASVRQAGKRLGVDLVLTRGERANLERARIDVRLMRDRQGRTVAQRAKAQAQGGFTVYRDYDGPDGIRAELYEFAREHRKLADLHVIGHTHQGREIIAIELTRGKRGHGHDHKHGSKPAVLYQGTTHAREWITTEVTRRLMHWFADNADDREVKRVLKTTELWFVPVVNPDGYQYTFDVERLWRKNLRDNDGDGDIDTLDGVDPNRNYPEHWNWDDEGSSSLFNGETYRGPEAVSEPEVEANIDLVEDIDPVFAISYHSYGPLLLYPQGWQVQTPSADDPIYVALSGTDDDPAIEGTDPGVSADLYTTNGEFTDWAHAEADVLAWTVELNEGCVGCGFVFPDVEALVQQEFEINLDLAFRVAQSADDPDDPVSHTGLDTEPFYLDVSEIDPWKANNPASDMTFDVSYAGGDDQPVDVLAKRDQGRVTLHYRINGGRKQTESTRETPDGETYGGNNAYNVYYHYLRGEVEDADVGDEVEVWFESRREESDHFTYDVVEDADADVLILAAEDRTGASNVPAYASTDPATPNHLSYFEEALSANGISYDVYDVDAAGRVAPDHVGVLDHYDAVVWYMGNDFVTRELGRGPGNASRLANDLMLEARAYLNDGGKLLYNGQWAGALWNGIAGTQLYDPVANEVCVVDGEVVLDRCQVISDKNDFVQYYLGAFLYNSDAGTNPETGQPFPLTGIADPYAGLGWDLNGADSADNQGHTASFLTTSSLLPPEAYPQFSSHAPAAWDTGGAGGAFEPFDGEQYLYSQRANISYKRLTRTIDLTGLSEGDPASLTFRASYDTEAAWDFLFVEAHTGPDDWTTLPEASGEITEADAGESCAAGWHELHPWLERYQTFVPADPNDPDSVDSCTPTGTSGEWNAASGRSDGWEQWTIDLSDYAGEQVEVSISYASDWEIQGIGAFIDAIEVSTGEGTTSFEDDGGADPLDGWTVAGPPGGSAPNANDWLRTESVNFEEGAAVATDDTLYFGFGLEGVAGADTRAEVMDRSIEYLLDDD
jgi:hypothetical protein